MHVYAGMRTFPSSSCSDGLHQSFQGKSGSNGNLQENGVPEYWQVEKVLCGRSGSALSGSLHLTAHHLIFRYDDVAEEEMWASSTFTMFMFLFTGVPDALFIALVGAAPSADPAWPKSYHVPYTDV